MLEVAALAAPAALLPPLTITATCRWASLAASSGNCDRTARPTELDDNVPVLDVTKLP